MARAERLLFRGALVLLGWLLYLPSVLFGRLPPPSPWSSCGTRSVPANAFLLGHGRDASFVNDVVRPLREMLTVLLFSGSRHPDRAGAARAAARQAPSCSPAVAAWPCSAPWRSRSTTSCARRAWTSGRSTWSGRIFVLSLALVTLGFALRPAGAGGCSSPTRSSG